MDRTRHLEELTERLRQEGYYTRYNTDMELITIRNYTPQQLAALEGAQDVYLVQRTRRTLQAVRKEGGVGRWRY